MSEVPISRYEFQDLERRVLDNERRLDEIDRIGTRGVAVLAVQVQGLVADVAKLEVTVEQHKAEHVMNRRWAIGMIVALLAAIGGLYPLIANIHGH